MYISLQSKHPALGCGYPPLIPTQTKAQKDEMICRATQSLEVESLGLPLVLWIL